MPRRERGSAPLRRRDGRSGRRLRSSRRCVAATNADPTSSGSLKPSRWATLTASLLNSHLDYNVAPQTTQPVIVWDEEFGTRTLHMMFWRFLPRYVTDPKQFKLSTINAKGETLLSNRMWHDSFLKRRCLIPADSFIEWRKEGKRQAPVDVHHERRSTVRSGWRVASLAVTRSQDTRWTPSRSSP